MFLKQALEITRCTWGNRYLVVRGLPWSLGVNKRPTVNASSPHPSLGHGRRTTLFAFPGLSFLLWKMRSLKGLFSPFYTHSDHICDESQGPRFPSGSRVSPPSGHTPGNLQWCSIPLPDAHSQEEINRFFKLWDHRMMPGPILSTWWLWGGKLYESSLARNVNLAWGFPCSKI